MLAIGVGQAHHVVQLPLVESLQNGVVDGRHLSSFVLGAQIGERSDEFKLFLIATGEHRLLEGAA